MPQEIKSADSTATLIKLLEEGKLTKSQDRESLLDPDGNIVAKRVDSNGDEDYYADVNQGFAPACDRVCLDWKTGKLGIKICVKWGCK